VAASARGVRRDDRSIRYNRCLPPGQLQWWRRLGRPAGSRPRGRPEDVSDGVLVFLAPAAP